MRMFPIRLAVSCQMAVLLCVAIPVAPPVQAGQVRALAPDAVVAVAEQVADAWIAAHPAGASDNGWENATFNSGNMALYGLVQDPKYQAYTRAWAESHHFGLQSNAAKPYFPDPQAAGQPYLDLQALDGDPADSAALISRLQAQMSTGNTS